MFTNGAKNIYNRFQGLQDKWNNNKVKLTKENSFTIVPFNVIAGYITSTENGLRANNSTAVADYSTFQRVFTGLQNLMAVWEGVWKVEKRHDNDLFLTKQVQEGRYFRGYINTSSNGLQMQPSKVDATFLAQFTQETFTVHSYEDLQDEDLFKLYIIPGLQEKWLYISNATKYYTLSKELHHIEIEFTTLNSQLAQSGGAVEQFIQKGAPGEGYAWPVVDPETGIPFVDEIKSWDVPVTSMQIEYSGAAAFNTAFAYGRPVKQKTDGGITHGQFNDRIEAPRLLLPLRLETPIPSPLNTKPSAEANWYAGLYYATQWASYEDWKKQFSQYFDLYQRGQYEGMLVAEKLGDIKSPEVGSIRASNVISDGEYEKILWDIAWKITIDHLFNCGATTHPNPQLSGNLHLKGDFSVCEMLAHNSFITSYIETLPEGKEQNTVWNLKDIPIVGGFLKLLTLGIPIGWNNRAIRLKADNIWFIMPTSIVEYGNVIMADRTDKAKAHIPLETFTGKRQDDATTYSGINATGSIFKFSLTDRFYKTIAGKRYIFNTVDLGQGGVTGIKTDQADSDYKYEANTKLLWDETCSPAPRDGNTPGYVIDTATHKTLAKLTYRLTFFSNDYEVWTGTYQSRSLFTTSIRDWNNTMKFSFWNEVNGKTISYPDAIVAPNPPTINFPLITIEQFKQSINAPIPDQSTTNVRDLFRDILYTVDQYTVTSKPAGIDVKYENQSTKILEYDTTPLGGITAFKNEYDKLALTINGQVYQIDVNELITKTEVKTPILSVNENKGRFDVLEKVGTSYRNRHITTFTQYFNQILRIYIDTNVIKIMAMTISTHTSTFDIYQGASNQTTFNFNVAELNQPAYEWTLFAGSPDQTIKPIVITNALAIPKQIEIQ